jgi:hypothetical protein
MELQERSGSPKRSWRCRGSNPGPLNRWRRHLRAQPSASFSFDGTPTAGFPSSYPELIFAPRSRNPEDAFRIAAPGPGEADTLRADGLLFS